MPAHRDAIYCPLGERTCARLAVSVSATDFSHPLLLSVTGDQRRENSHFTVGAEARSGGVGGWGGGGGQRYVLFHAGVLDRQTCPQKHNLPVESN